MCELGACVCPLVYPPGNVDNPPVFSPPALSRIGVLKKLAPSARLGLKSPPFRGKGPATWHRCVFSPSYQTHSPGNERLPRVSFDAGDGRGVVESVGGVEGLKFCNIVFVKCSDRFISDCKFFCNL